MDPRSVSEDFTPDPAPAASSRVTLTTERDMETFEYVADGMEDVATEDEEHVTLLFDKLIRIHEDTNDIPTEFFVRNNDDHSYSLFSLGYKNPISISDMRQLESSLGPDFVLRVEFDNTVRGVINKELRGALVVEIATIQNDSRQNAVTMEHLSIKRRGEQQEQHPPPHPHPPQGKGKRKSHFLYRLFFGDSDDSSDDASGETLYVADMNHTFTPAKRIRCE